MRIFLNDQETRKFDFTGVKTLADLVAGVLSQKIIEEGEVISTIEVDGSSINPLDEDLKAIALDPAGKAEVRLKTESVRSLLITALRDGRDTCEALDVDCRTAAEKFRGENLADAAQFFAGLTERIIEIIGYLTELNQHLLSILEGEDTEIFEKTRDRFHSVLKEALGYQEEADWVMLADLLEYEFAEVFSEFSRYLTLGEGRILAAGRS